MSSEAKHWPKHYAPPPLRRAASGRVQARPLSVTAARNPIQRQGRTPEGEGRGNFVNRFACVTAISIFASATPAPFPLQLSIKMYAGLPPHSKEHFSQRSLGNRCESY